MKRLIGHFETCAATAKAGDLDPTSPDEDWTITLAEARTKATDCRKMLLDGIDPIDARNALRSQAQINAAKTKTFA